MRPEGHAIEEIRSQRDYDDHTTAVAVDLLAEKAGLTPERCLDVVIVWIGADTRRTKEFAEFAGRVIARLESGPDR